MTNPSLSECPTIVGNDAYSAKFWDKRVLILGHITEIYGSVKALIGYSEKNMGKLVSVLHPLPCAAISHSEFKISIKGICNRTSYMRNPKIPEFLSYLQHFFFSFSFTGGVLEHIRNIHEAVNEIYRCLVPGGFTTNTVPHTSLSTPYRVMQWGNIPDIPVLRNLIEFVEVDILRGKAYAIRL